MLGAMEVPMHPATESAAPGDEGPLRGGLSRDHLERALQAIESRLAERLTIHCLAATIPMSPFHFARSFRVSTGRPPHRYLLERRLVRAQELLGRKAWPVAVVAQATGFRSASHFTALFRKHVGETPARYRTRARSATRASINESARASSAPTAGTA
jgi:AraC family transcriptional regulator